MDHAFVLTQGAGGTLLNVDNARANLKQLRELVADIDRVMLRLYGPPIELWNHLDDNLIRLEPGGQDRFIYPHRATFGLAADGLRTLDRTPAGLTTTDATVIAADDELEPPFGEIDRV